MSEIRHACSGGAGQARECATLDVVSASPKSGGNSTRRLSGDADRFTRNDALSHHCVVTRLFGGLGNQLFQYAAGRAVALRNDSSLLLDIRPLQSCSLRDYDLGHFNIAARVANGGELPPDRKARLKFLLWRSGSAGRQRLVREHSLKFNSEFQDARGNSVLHGYWQCEKYFCEFGDQIRNELAVKTPASEANCETLRDIESSNAVSVHIRRGDYVASDKNRSVFASCSPEYYAAAAELLRDRLGTDLRFFVFSDDPDWVAKTIKLPGAMDLVRHNSGATAYEDLRLMCACRHHIIANSTFSWWGAWLNPSPQKQVIAPRRWFNGEKDQQHDIVPESWTRV